MKKIVSLLLVFCLLSVALIACGDDGEVTEPQATESVSETGPVVQGGTLASTNEYGDNEFVSAVPVDELDFQGEVINILCRNEETCYREWGKETVGDDPLDQAIQTRNEVVTEGLNLVVNIVKKGPYGFEQYLEEYNNFIKNDVELGLHEYDAVAAFAYAATDTKIRTFLANLIDDDTFPYFDFELPCWNQALVKNVTVNNRLYVVAGDVNLSMFDATMMVWCNKTLYDGLKNSEDPDIQDVALSEEGLNYTHLYSWTQYYENRPNSAEDCQDFHGWSMTKNHYDSCLPAWDIKLINTKNDGTHEFNIIGNDIFEEKQTALRDILDQQGTVTACTCGTGLMGHFTEGDILFCLGNLYANAETNLKIREMEDEYCILPLPKYDEMQEEYATSSQMGFNIMSVLDHYESEVPTKGEAVSAYLQYASEQSYKDVRGYYFEKIVKDKYFGVDDTNGTVTKSQQIFTMILDSVYYDVAIIYSPVINDITWLWKDNIEKDGSLENAFKSNTNSGGGNLRTQEQYEQALRDFDAWMFE